MVQQWPRGLDNGGEGERGDVCVDDLVGIISQTAHDLERARRQETAARRCIARLAEGGLGAALVLRLGVDAGQDAIIGHAGKQVEAHHIGGRGDRHGLGAFGRAGRGGRQRGE